MFDKVATGQGGQRRLPGLAVDFYRPRHSELKRSSGIRKWTACTVGTMPESN
jgi:hypothetical protein